MHKGHGAIDFTEERLELFPTRFFRRTYEGLDGFNAKMRDVVLAKEAQSGARGITRSNVGSWHSQNDLLRWPRPEIAILVELFKSTILHYLSAEIGREPDSIDVVMALEAWANVSRKGDYSRPHVHPMAHFSLVYYVDVGDAEGPGLGGSIEFLDPRSGVTMLSTPGIPVRDSVNVRPMASTMLVFPAWIHHYVHPYAGTRPRISIACNATLQRIEDKRKRDPNERPDALIIED